MFNIAVEKENADIVKLFLMNDKLDINEPDIFKYFIHQIKPFVQIKFRIKYFNDIHNPVL